MSGILEGFAAYCTHKGATFEQYTSGVDLLMEADGYWLRAGYAAVLAALDTTEHRPAEYVVRV